MGDAASASPCTVERWQLRRTRTTLQRRVYMSNLSWSPAEHPDRDGVPSQILQARPALRMAAGHGERGRTCGACIRHCTMHVVQRMTTVTRGILQYRMRHSIPRTAPSAKAWRPPPSCAWQRVHQLMMPRDTRVPVHAVRHTHELLGCMPRVTW